MKELIVHHHLGIGDYIICNGLINYLIEKWGINKIFLVTKLQNFTCIKSLYGLQDKVELLPFESRQYDEHYFSSIMSSKMGVPLLKITAKDNLNFDRQFYQSLDINFKISYDYFKIDENSPSSCYLFERLIHHNQYALVSQDTSIGKLSPRIITELPVVYVTRATESIFDWVKIIRNAQEIHCVDSSFIHLADRLDISNKRLYYHDFRRGSTFNLRHDWDLIKY
jgi:hypothetical protein